MKYWRCLFVPLLVVLSTECDESGCRVDLDVSLRIASGEEAERNSRPYQVALYKRVGAEELGFCGGSLITPEWVLTSAHCCYHGDELVDNVQAVLGAHSLHDRYENGRRTAAVAELVVHPGFEPGTFAQDLALMRLANVVQLSDTINVIQVPYRNITTFNFAGYAATASGWGIPADGVPFISPTLRVKQLTVVTDSFCSSQYSALLPAGAVCGYDAASGGTCKGDNGGPLTIFYSATNTTILIGVASFVAATGCNTDLPSVFTRVQGHLDWIHDTTGLVIH